MTELQNKKLVALRPQISTEEAATTSEQFQNQTLRPILKLQNELLIRVFRQYITKHKNTFRKLSAPEKETYIKKSVRQDPHLRHFVRGIVVGHFTEPEWQEYSVNEEEMNKRMLNLIEQRLLSQLTEI